MIVNNRSFDKHKIDMLVLVRMIDALSDTDAYNMRIIFVIVILTFARMII